MSWRRIRFAPNLILCAPREYVIVPRYWNVLSLVFQRLEEDSTKTCPADNDDRSKACGIADRRVDVRLADGVIGIRPLPIRAALIVHTSECGLQFEQQSLRKRMNVVQ